MTSSSSPPSTPPPTTSNQSHDQRPKAKPIPNPRRLLILTPTSHSLTTIPPLLHTLTGVAVDNPPTAEAATTPTATTTETGTETTPATTTTFAGYTTHPPLHIKNKYYTADIPIWVDEIPLSATTTETASEAKESAGTTQWKTEFSGPEARVVRDAIGGVMVCIRNPQPPSPGGGDGGGEEDIAERNDVKSIKDFLRCIGEVKRLVEEERGDIGFGEVLGVIVLEESSSGSKSASSADKKRVSEDDDELDTGPAEEEPFSIPWWEDQLDEIGLMDFDVVKWDSGAAEEDDKRDKYGGAFFFLQLYGYMGHTY